MRIFIYLWTSASEGIDGVDGSEKDAVGGDEARRVAKLQDIETLLVVEAGLPYTQSVVKWQYLC